MPGSGQLRSIQRLMSLINSPFLFLSSVRCPPSLIYLFPGVFNTWRLDQESFAKHIHTYTYTYIYALKTLGFPNLLNDDISRVHWSLNHNSVRVTSSLLLPSNKNQSNRNYLTLLRTVVAVQFIKSSQIISKEFSILSEI